MSDIKLASTRKKQETRNKLQINFKSQFPKIKKFEICDLKFEIYLYPCILFLVSCAWLAVSFALFKQ